MTKEEYENLLQSDYWKGYSYSLIKERNFTCEDCGRSFPNMRNMLQVHHLVYRDANPWSYKPEELIVLCKECHQKRHGIYPDSKPITEEETTSEKNEEQPYINTYTEGMSKRYAYDNFLRKKRNWFKFAVLVYAIIFLFYFVLKDDSKEQKEQEIATSVETPVSEKVKPGEPIEEIPQVIVKEKPTTKPRKTKQKKSDTEKALVEQTQTPAIEPSIYTTPIMSQEENMDSKTNENTKSTLELLEEHNHANVVKQAQRVGVSTEGSTIEILERINRKALEELLK